MALVRKVPTGRLRPEEVTLLRELFGAAWRDDPEPFEDEDWEHAVGGIHFLLEEERSILAHASVVERELHAGDRPLVTGYVEAVATWPALQGRGHGSALMREVGEHIDRTFELGALGGEPSFYERLGWVRWRGQLFVRTDDGPVRTPEEEGSVLVRVTPATPDLDLEGPLTCDWRPGDVW
jgi:aminoglycoside 2'-N-acetyltransferase I